jgi:hypothetical protein
MGGACGTHRREKRSEKRGFVGTHKGKRPLEKPNAGGIIILKWILHK